MAAIAALCLALADLERTHGDAYRRTRRLAGVQTLRAWRDCGVPHRPAGRASGDVVSTAEPHVSPSTRAATGIAL
jgi:hypothetical protein